MNVEYLMKIPSMENSIYKLQRNTRETNRKVNSITFDRIWSIFEFERFDISDTSILTR